jgi:hypothetical protein
MDVLPQFQIIRCLSLVSATNHMLIFTLCVASYMHQFTYTGSDTESVFFPKVDSAAATGDRSMWILCLRVSEVVLKKN